MDGYIHAPSLQHAATAAVLRSGFLANPGETTFAVDLTSRRARVARWLLGGVRNGQNLGALLGYRFERALHDAELDTEIPALPAPRSRSPDGAAEPTPPGRPRRPVVAQHRGDRRAQRRRRDAAGPGPGTAKSIAKDRIGVGPIMDDVVDALDAVGDLVLAESVHQLVGGSPLRAGRGRRHPGPGRGRTGRVAVACAPRTGPGP